MSIINFLGKGRTDLCQKSEVPRSNPLREPTSPPRYVVDPSHAKLVQWPLLSCGHKPEEILGFV